MGLYEEEFQQRLLGVEAVFGLVPDDALRSFDDGGRDLFAAMGGQAVHEQRVPGGLRHQCVVDLVTGEGLNTLGPFLFLAHTGPDIGNHQIGTLCRAHGIRLQYYPLAGRREDIPLLAEHFLKKHALHNQRQVTHIEPEVMRILLDYDWPGNVRQLENVIERGVVLCHGDRLEEGCLPPRLTGAVADQTGLGETADLPLAELERRHILATLERHDWHRVKVAEILGIDRRTLYRKIKEYGFEPSEDGES